jgi:hypothetical protein
VSETKGRRKGKCRRETNPMSKRPFQKRPAVRKVVSKDDTFTVFDVGLATPEAEDEVRSKAVQVELIEPAFEQRVIGRSEGDVER